MPIAAADIQFRYSGGASGVAATSLGGAISNNGITDASANNLFDDVSGAESAAGDVEYKGIYIRNNDGSRTLVDARIYISALTSSADTELDIALADEAVSTTIETIADESTAPVGPTFSRPTTYAGGLQLNGSTGLGPSGVYKGVWVRRTVTAGAAAAADSGTIKVEGDSAA